MNKFSFWPQLRRFLISPWILGFILIIPATWPFFNSQFFPMHDSTHVARLAELAQSLNSGHFPPIWSQNLGFGYGMPLFEFYAPLPYFIAYGFQSLGFSPLWSIKLVFLLTFYFSFLGTYYLARLFFKPQTAYLAGIISLYLPYRALDVYVRGALGELVGLTLIPWIFWSVTRLHQHPRVNRFLIFTFTLTLFFLSHNLVVYMVFPLFCLYALVSWKFVSPQQKKSLILTLVGTMLALGLSSYYLIPALIESSFTSVNQLTQSNSHYSQHFIYLRQLWQSKWGYGGSIYGLEDDISFALGKIFVLLFFLTLPVLPQIFRTKSSWFYSFCFFIFVISIFMSSGHSTLIWQTIPFIQFLQFPWRYLGLILVVLPFIIAPITHLSKKIPPKIFTPLYLFLILIIIWSNLPLFRPEKFLADNQSLYSTDSSFIQTNTSRSLVDYLHPELSYLVNDQKEQRLNPPAQRFTYQGKLRTDMSIIVNRPHEFIVRLMPETDGVFTANVFTYPGWQWYLNSTPINHQVNSDLPTMSVSVPASKDPIDVTAKLLPTPTRSIAQLISLFSLVIYLYLVAYWYWRERSKS